MLWAPLDHTRLAWDTLFIIDLTVTSVVLIPQIAAWVHGQAERPLWVAPAVWVAFCVAAFALAPWARSLDVPFSDESAAAACVVFGVFLLVPLRHRGRSRFGRMIWCRMGVALLAGYIGFAAGMHSIALGQVRQYADEGRHQLYESGRAASAAMAGTMGRADFDPWERLSRFSSTCWAERFRDSTCIAASRRIAT